LLGRKKKRERGAWEQGEVLPAFAITTYSVA